MKNGNTITRLALCCAMAIGILFASACSGSAQPESSDKADGGVSQSASSDSQVGAASSASSSTATAVYADSGYTFPDVNYNPQTTGDISSVISFAKPEPMTKLEAKRADRAIRAYTPPQQESLLINEAPVFYYGSQLVGDAKALNEAISVLLEDPVTDDHYLTATLGEGVEAEDLEPSVMLALLAIEYDHPEYFWLRNAIEVNVDSFAIGDEVYFCLSRPYKNYEKEMSAFNNAVKDFLDDIDTDGKDYEVALAIHDKLSELVSYDYDVAEDGVVKDFAHTAYGALVANSSGEANTAVCDGYSLAYEYLLQQVGIEATVVVGDAGFGEDIGGHAWNIVKLDGEWYEVDTTWDDQQSEWVSFLKELEGSGSDDAAVAMLKESLGDSDYYSHITHYLCNVTTEVMADFEPSGEDIFELGNGEFISLLSPSKHIRANDAGGWGYLGDLIALAPTAKGVKHIYGR